MLSPVRRLLTMRMMTMMTLLVVTLVLRATSVAGYCAGLGANPGFRGPPKVEQVWGFQEDNNYVYLHLIGTSLV